MEKTLKLSFEEILENIEALASSQGFYGRLYNSIMELDEDSYDELVEEWDGKFSDIVEFIMYLEG